MSGHDPTPPAPTPVPRSLRERLVRGGAWVLVGKLITAASTLGISALVTRLLPKETAGVFFMGDRIIWLISMLALLGMNTAVVRVVAESLGKERPGLARGAITLCYRLALLGFAVVLGATWVGGGAWAARTVWGSPELGTVIAIVALWGAFHGLQVLTSEAFRGFQDLLRATLFGGVITGVINVAALSVAWMAGIEVTLPGLITLFAGAAATSLAIGTFTLRRRLKRLGPAEAYPRSALLSIALPLWVNGFLAWGLTQSDLLILGIFVGAADVAVYGAAAKLVALVLMSLMLVNLLVPPFVAELYARRETARLERMLRLTATVAGLPAIAVLVAYLTFGPWILDTVYRDGYSAGASVLAILSVGRLVHVFTGSAAITLSMTGHQRTLVSITAVTSLLTVTAAFFAGRHHGAVGVATATAGGVIVQNLSAWWAAHRRTGMWTHVSIPGRDDLALFLRRNGSGGGGGA